MGVKKRRKFQTLFQSVSKIKIKIKKIFWQDTWDSVAILMNVSEEIPDRRSY